MIVVPEDGVTVGLTEGETVGVGVNVGVDVGVVVDSTLVKVAVIVPDPVTAAVVEAKLEDATVMEPLVVHAAKV
jgi:hypothetical protein